MGSWLDTLPDDLLDQLGDMPHETIQMLCGLNPSQLRAVITIKGPVQINAVAGSGKTRVLTHRITYMKSIGIKASEIFCTTFTKIAREQMENRLELLIPNSMYRMQLTLGTTHSIALRILKKEYTILNHHLCIALDRKKRDILMKTSQKIFMEKIKKDMLKDRSIPIEVLKELDEIAIPQFMKTIGLSKNEGLDNWGYADKHAGTTNNKLLAYIEFYHRYEQKKWDEKFIDGDDMLFLLWKLFKAYPDILAKYQRIYKYFLVDETQDNNDIQYELICMLAYPQNNIFVVGDDDQSMYGFRGANPANFIYFKDRYKNCTIIGMEDNYRSAPGILRVANAMISNNTERILKQLVAHKQVDDVSVYYSAYNDEFEEAQYVVNEIEVLTSNKGFQPKNIAILYRTNAQSRAFEDKLIIKGIPYVIHGGVSFYERMEVKDLVAYLRFVVDSSDFYAFERIYNAPKRFLGKVFLSKVEAYDGDIMKTLSSHTFLSSLKGYEKDGIASFKKLINELRDIKDNGGTTQDLLDHIIKDGGYEAHLKEDGDEEDEGNSRMENVETLKFAVGKFNDITNFLDYMTMMTTEKKHDIDGVQLMTIHKAKGSEFPIAFTVGMSEGILPHFKAVEAVDNGEKPLGVEEERRLGYVAITRAETLCYMSSLGSFNGRRTAPSRFIGEVMKFLEIVKIEREEETEVVKRAGEGEVNVTLACINHDCRKHYGEAILIEGEAHEGEIVSLDLCPECVGVAFDKLVMPSIKEEMKAMQNYHRD